MTTTHDIADDITHGPQTIRASTQDGTYPRPQLMRRDWHDLSGPWGFEYDDEDRGRADAWYDRDSLERTIIVPFPPESPASQIGDTSFHRVVWYRRAIDASDFAAAGLSESAARLVLHLGAVDYRADVWLDGHHLGSHEGGHTPFSFDITDLIRGDEAHNLVVRAEDDPTDVTQPRGKQDWLLEPHDVWYDRTSGIWQPVWLEAVASRSIRSLGWSSDLVRGTASVDVVLSAAPSGAATVAVQLSVEGRMLASTTSAVTRDTVSVTVELPDQLNGQAYERLLWSPDRPTLLDAVVTFSDDTSTDVVYSYLGLRAVRAERGAFLLNDRPFYLRSVLSQGFWPQSHLAAPSPDALRAEAQLIKDLGFNATRIHQKIEDPRFLYWTDRLGILAWEEMPSALEFSPRAMRRVVSEWSEAVQRDISHPSIVAWVPLNESWGVQHIATDQRAQHYAAALYNLTKSLDGSRPVVYNDGWEQGDTDIFSIHDYEGAPDVIESRYSDAAAISRLFDGIGPAGRPLRLDTAPDRQQPVMLTEFGGVRFETGPAAKNAWGYTSASSHDDYRHRVSGLFSAIDASTVLAGDCYTQLTDTQQEANGLVDEHRVPKLPIEVLADIIRRS